MRQPVKKVLALSGGKDSMACLHLMQDELDCAIYVDTGFAYPETHAMIAYAETLIPIRRLIVDRAKQHHEYGLPADVVPIEWTTVGQAVTKPKAVLIQPSLDCCYFNIANPFQEEAKRLGATHVVFGQRNDERARATSKNGDVVNGLIRLHPIEDWTRAQVLDYLATKMKVPDHYALTMTVPPFTWTRKTAWPGCETNTLTSTGSMPRKTTKCWLPFRRV